MGYSVTQIWLGSRRVGIVGLDAALKEVSALGLTDAEAVKAEILTRLRKSNYIAGSVEAEYGRAVHREYRRLLGEDVPEEQAVLEIRVYGGD